MGRSQESFHKKEVRKRKEKKRLEKEKKRLERKEQGKNSGDDMIAYVDEYGRITDTPPDQDDRTEADASEIEVSVPRQDPDDENNRLKNGRLDFFNESRGYGFITESGTGQSIFVHVNDFQDDIQQGDRVSFEVGKGQRGPTAFNVKLLQ
jgi:cold shock CspA family protein